MDPLDFAIYRYLSPDGEARFWAGRRLIDPTIPAREIAERVGVSENGVRARLRALEGRGYLRGSALVLNPSLFGAEILVEDLPIGSASEAERVLRDLALVDGVVFARDTLDEGRRSVRVHFVSESPAVTARRAALIGRLAPSGPASSPQPYWVPVCDRELSALDWRVLGALYRTPDAPVAEVARSVGISLKTAARRRHELLAARAFWWTHSPETEEFPLALIQVDLRAEPDRGAVSEAVSKSAPSWMPVAPDGLGLDPSRPQLLIAGLVPADAPTVLERLVQRLSSAPGVLAVRRTFALGSRSYSAWFGERLAERLPAPATPPAGPRARVRDRPTKRPRPVRPTP